MGKLHGIETGFSMLYKWGKFSPKGKINPETLGWVRPDGVVSYASEKSAIQYAKNTIVKELNAVVPREKSVVVDKNLVTFSQVGTERNCGVPLNAKGLWFHGHTPNPDGSTNTFSNMDYKALFNCPEVETAIILNKNGESAVMKKLLLKKGWFSKLLGMFLSQEKVDAAKIGSRIGWLEAKYAKLVCKLNEEQLNLKVRKALRKQIIAQMKGDAKEIEQCKAEFEKVAKEQLINFDTQKGAKDMHALWQKNQKRLGIEYEMNFSELKP